MGGQSYMQKPQINNLVVSGIDPKILEHVGYGT
jgi:hypothetical protein